MKRRSLFNLAAAAILVAVAGRAQATEVGSSRTFGLGFQIGEPTAITAKVFAGGANAYDFGVGFGGWCYDGSGHSYSCDNLQGHISLHADYLYQENIVNMTNRLDWYAGFGGRVVLWNYGPGTSGNGVALLARVPIGVAVTFRRPSFLEAYLEVAPSLRIFPPLWFTVDVGLGVRAYF
jgi:hypothetical protein